MKGCLLAAVILLLVVGTVILNAVYIHHTARELNEAVEALPAVPDPVNTPAIVAGIRESLEQKAPLLGITVAYATIDRVSEALIALESYARTGDLRQYDATLALLSDLIEELTRTERMTLDTIL